MGSAATTQVVVINVLELAEQKPADPTPPPTAPLKQHWPASDPTMKNADFSGYVNVDRAAALKTAALEEPKGTWLHAAYHLTSGTSGPQILSVPLALASMGWGPGLLMLCIGGALSFYAYRLQISVIDAVTKARGAAGCQRFRDLTVHALGEKWSNYLVGPLQFVVCFATVVSCIVLGGQALKAIFQGQELSLYQFTIVFGCLHMLLSQLPSLHSLRHLNLISLIANVSYCILIIYGCVITALSNGVSNVSYGVTGATVSQKLFNVFNALSILSNVYGNVITVEIQSTIRAPAAKNMVKGLWLCYVVVLGTILPVGIAGYWAFGNQSNGNVLLNIFPSIQAAGQVRPKYLPSWVCVLVNVLIVVQLAVSSLMYSHPTFAVLEDPIMVDKNSSVSYPVLRNILSRLLSRCIFTVFATLLAAMLPYFGSMNALIGALGYTPLVFVVPIILHISIFRLTDTYKHTSKLWLNYTMVALFTLVSILGCLASFQQLVLDAKKYQLFANL